MKVGYTEIYLICEIMGKNTKRNTKYNKNNYREIYLFVEDSYGVVFFKKLIENINNLNILKKPIKISKRNGITTPQSIGGYLCNPKIERDILAASNFTTCEKIIIVIDGDKNQNKINENKDKIKKHIPKNINKPCKEIIIDYEIEEWICMCNNIKWGNDKPSDILKSKLKYKKSQLPNYGNKLDIIYLYNNSNSFKQFIYELDN